MIKHFDHVTDDLGAEVERLRAAGIRPRNEVMDFHDRRLVFLDGPEGAVVELAEWKTKQSPQGR